MDSKLDLIFFFKKNSTKILKCHYQNFSFHISLDLKIVPRAVSKVAALRRLDLSNNAISEIYAYTFFGSAKLSYLNLEANRLTHMAENAFLGLGGCFSFDAKVPDFDAKYS